MEKLHPESKKRNSLKLALKNLKDALDHIEIANAEGDFKNTVASYLETKINLQHSIKRVEKAIKVNEKTTETIPAIEA